MREYLKNQMIACVDRHPSLCEHKGWKTHVGVTVWHRGDEEFIWCVETNNDKMYGDGYNSEMADSIGAIMYNSAKTRRLDLDTY